MSTSLSRSSGSAGASSHPTRQQLDELDALLQRMLALPVNQADDDVLAEISAAPKATGTMEKEPVAYRTTESGGDNAKPPPAPRLDEAHVAPPSDALEDDSWVPLSSTWKPSPHTWKPLAQSWQQPRSKAPAKSAQESPPRREEPVETPAAPPAPPAAVAAKPEPLTPVVAEALVSVPETPVTAEPPPPDWVRPLLWFNVTFDLLLLPWGLPGRWLRRDGPGRPVVGVVGLLLLAAAVGLSVLEWFGWTWDALLDKIR